MALEQFIPVLKLISIFTLRLHFYRVGFYGNDGNHSHFGGNLKPSACVKGRKVTGNMF